MKQTIEGFNQEYALTLEGVDEYGTVIKLDHTDLVILRWFTDIYPTLPHEEFGGKKWVMMTECGRMIFEDLPLLNLSISNCSERLFKLVRLEILDYCDHCDGEPPEPFSFFSFGKNYEPLCGQRTAEKDFVITATDKIVGYLNKKAHTNFKTNSKLTRRYIFERLAEGYAAQDFKMVIDKKYDDWAETEFEKYLRPSTLFGDRFDDYLNEAKHKKNYCDSEGMK